MAIPPPIALIDASMFVKAVFWREFGVLDGC
jgi:hypothetical protein